MGLGEIIRLRRGQLGLTQDQVSARVGISKPYLSNIETARVKNPPTDGVITRLEGALDFAPGELRKLAHLARTPSDVRDEHEQLSAEVEKLRGVLAQLAAGPEGGRAAGIDLDAILRKIRTGRANVAQVTSTGRVSGSSSS